MTTTPATIKLTAAQQQIIAAAAANPNRALVPPTGRNGKPLGKTTKLVETLFGQGLVREVRTKADLPLWREDETGKRYSLVLTKAGHAAAAQRTGSAEDTEHQPDADREVGANGPDAEAASPRTGSKLAGVIDLLGRPGGAPVSELMAATGWLPHTTRAALTGLRKRGYAVVREATEGGSVYRIADGATAAAA